MLDFITRRSNLPRLLRCVTPCAAIAVAGVTPLHADTTTLTATADTFIQHSDTNQAVASDWAKGAVNYADTGWHESQQRVMRGLIRFDLAELPQGVSITSATLTLHTGLRWDNDGGTPDETIEIHAYRLLKPWTEGAVNIEGYAGDGPSWESSAHVAGVDWDVAGADGAGTDRAADATDTGTADSAFTTWDVTADVEGMLAGELENHGWLLVAADEASQGDRIRWSTREKETASLRPTLKITYAVVPEPGSLGLLGLGLPLLAARRRRQR